MHCFEIGHARAERGRMFTWPASEHSQVPLAHITLRYSCHQAIASGAERVRDTKERQRERETGRNEKDKKTETKQREWNWESLWKCVHISILFNFISLTLNLDKLELSRVTLLALVDCGSVVCTCLWKRASTPTSLHTSSENRSQSLVLAWKLRPHVERTSVATH